MKKVITIIAMALLVSISGFSQNAMPGQSVDSLSNVSINSKIALKYSGRENKSDTIYVSMTQWVYNPERKAAVGFLKEYVKKNAKFIEIGQSRVQFTRAEINNAFTALNRTVIPNDKFTVFFEDFLTKSLIKEIKRTINNGSNTIYGTVPSNWEIMK